MTHADANQAKIGPSPRDQFAIRIRRGVAFLDLHVHDLRHVADALHDAADELETAN